jgi:hypothetical protein
MSWGISSEEDSAVFVCVGSRSRDCGASGDRTASHCRNEKSGTAGFLQFEACASSGAGLWELPFQSHGLALVQPCCPSLLVGRAARARRQGTVGFFRVGNVFAMAKAGQIGINLWTDIDRQDATAALQVHAFRSATQRNGEDGSVFLGEGRLDSRTIAVGV